MAKETSIHLRISKQEKEELERISRIQGFKNVSQYLRHAGMKTKLSSNDKEIISQELNQIINLLQSLLFKIKNI